MTAATPAPNEADVEAIRARLAASRSGQWYAIAPHGDDWEVRSRLLTGTLNQPVICEYVTELDAQFIAAAPTDIDALLAALATANEQRDAAVRRVAEQRAETLRIVDEYIADTQASLDEESKVEFGLELEAQLHALKSLRDALSPVGGAGVGAT